MASGFTIDVSEDAKDFVKEMHEIVNKLDFLIGKLQKAVYGASDAISEAAKVVEKAEALMKSGGGGLNDRN